MVTSHDKFFCVCERTARVQTILRFWAAACLKKTVCLSLKIFLCVKSYARQNLNQNEGNKKSSGSHDNFKINSLLVCRHLAAALLFGIRKRCLMKRDDRGQFASGHFLLTTHILKVFETQPDFEPEEINHKLQVEKSTLNVVTRFFVSRRSSMPPRRALF